MSTPAAEIAYIGIGSNLGDPAQQVKDVIPRLGKIKNTQLLKQSSLYQTEAVSDAKQDDYINAVASIKTTLQPFELLLELQAMEYAFYRHRDDQQQWGPRTMDLDILLYGQYHQQDSHLTIPHPQIAHRLFVLLPMQEITDNLYIPGLGSVDYLIEQAPQMRIKILES